MNPSLNVALPAYSGCDDGLQLECHDDEDDRPAGRAVIASSRGRCDTGRPVSAGRFSFWDWITFTPEQKRIMASIKLPDGSIRDVPDGTTVAQLAESIGRGLAKAAVVGRVDGRLVDLAYPLTGSHEVSIVTDRDQYGLYVMRHSTAH